MAIVFQNNKYNITIDSKTIIGVMGKNYEKFLSSLIGDSVYYLNKEISVSNKNVLSLLDINNKKVFGLIEDFDFEKLFNKKVYELSHSEQTILKYLLMVSSNKKINVIIEPFQDLDLVNKKKIILLIKEMVKDNKTIIIGTNNSNNLYQLCKKLLLINSKDYYYGDIDSFNDKKLLKKYDIDMPDIVKFIEIANKKGIKLKKSYDIRDLIKDVYRNVS